MGLHAAENPLSSVDGARTGRALAAALDIAGDMSAGAYDQAVRARPSVRATDGHFAETATRLEAELTRLDERIALARTREPRQPEQLAQLEQLRDLTAEARAVFEGLAQAHSGSGEDHAGAVLGHLARLEARLTETDPQLLGTTNHTALLASVRELGTVVGGYGEMRSSGQAGALDTFVARTYRRLQQIESGQRRRANEPASAEGALQTYRNDQSDARVFVGRFARLQRALERGEFGTRSDYEQAMLQAVPGTSDRFQEGVRLLARARWQSHQATEHTVAGQDHLQSAAYDTRAAYTQLQSAEADLGVTSVQLQLSEHALTQSDPAAARQATELAETFRGRAETELAEHARLLRQGQSSRRAAQAHLRLAAAYLRVSNATLNLVEAGRYGHLVQAEASATRSHNQQVATQICELSHGALDLRDQQTQMRSAAGQLETWSRGLGTAIGQLEGATTLQEVELAVDAHVGEGARRAHALVASSFEGVELSSEARAFMNDPSSLSAEDRADVREELKEVFEDHPEVARRVAGHILEMRATLRTERAALVDAHGEDSDLVAAFDSLEHGYLQSWMENDGVVLEALLSSPSQPTSARALGSLQNWIADTRARYSDRYLLDPERASAGAEQFHQWMQDQPSMAERYEEVRDDYGSPSARVPMTLHLGGSGQLVSFNAYVFQDGDTFKALNPLDGRIYSADSQSGALQRLASEAQLGAGILRYAEGGEIHRSLSAAQPEGSLLADIGMGVVGALGGVLLFAPEPTTLTKWGGGAMVAASSAYFVGKGSIAMYDLVEHETFGNNAQTWGATLDIASGALMFLRGAGALGSMARTESQMVAHLTRIGESAALGRAELAALTGGVGLAGHGLAQIYHDDNLSDGQKLQAASEMLAGFAIPVGLVAGYRGLARASRGRAARGQVEQAHQRYMRALGETEALARRTASSDNPHVRAQLRRSLDAAVTRARTLYDSPSLRNHPELRRSALETLDRLDAIRTSLPEAPAEATSPQADASHPIGEMHGYRETVGWAGEPTATPPRGQAHRASVHRGMERMPSTMQSRLADLIGRATRGSTESNERLAELHQRHGRLLYQLAEAERLGHGQEAARLSAELEGLPNQIQYAEVQRARQMRSDRNLAVREMVAFRESLMGPEAPARARAEQLGLDSSVQDPAAVREAATLFFRLTGDVVDPSGIRVSQRLPRAQTHRDGRLDVGRGQPQTILHELGHQAEWARSSIYESATSWRQARAEEAHGETRVGRLRDLTGSDSFRPEEVAVEDHFSREYVGKQYSDATTEVFTTGIEAFTAPDRMLDFYLQDPEHFFLTVGMLTPPGVTP